MGAPHHIYMELLKSMTGVDIRHIPYRGGGPALNDVVAGHVPMMFGDVGQVTGLIREGRLKALGVTVGTRIETIPEVPTLIEAGLAGYEANSWQSMVAPANVSASDRRSGLNAALDRSASRACDQGALSQARNAATVEHAGGIRRLPACRNPKMGADHQGGRRDRGLSREAMYEREEEPPCERTSPSGLWFRLRR